MNQKGVSIPNLPPVPEPDPFRRLNAIKTVHTLVWALFVGAIVALPISAGAGRYDLALVFTGVVLFEVLVLLVNGWACPLTAIAARYTSDRKPNFDIWLPPWLARYNKDIFGSLFVLGLAFTLVRWMGWLG